MDPRGSRFPILRESTQDRVPIGLLPFANRKSPLAIRIHPVLSVFFHLISNGRAYEKLPEAVLVRTRLSRSGPLHFPGSSAV